MREYQNFEIIIQAKDSAGQYPLFASSPSGEASGTMTLSASDYAEHLKLDEMGSVAGQTAVLQSVGRMLFARLLPDPIQRLYERSRDMHGLRVRLIINPPELGWLHWEYLYDERDGSFPATSTQTVLVRHIPMDRKIEPITVSGPLRILVMIAAPKDLPTLNVAREKTFMQQELAGLVQTGRVELDIAEGTQRTRCTKTGVEHLPYNRRIATVPGLQDLLREGYHAFHFIGHGVFDQMSQTGELALEDEDTGYKRELKAEVLRVLFRDASIKLAVLNGCETAVTSEKEPLLGAAPALVKAGIPAVVAMQFSIPDQTAITFSRTFYGALADSFPVDAAVAESRKAIYARYPDRRDWGIPVLFMRSPDGVLWKMNEPSKQGSPEQSQQSGQEQQKTSDQTTPEETKPISPAKEAEVMASSKDLHDKLIKFFTSIPDINILENQRALLKMARLDAQLSGMLTPTTNPTTFFPLVLSTMEQYGTLEDGRNPVLAVLEAAKSFVGPKGKAESDGLIKALRGETGDEHEPKTPSAPSNDKSQTGGNSVNITFGNGANIKGFTFGNGNVSATDVNAQGDFIQNVGGAVNVMKTTAAAPAVTSKEEMLAVLQEIGKLIAGIEGGSKRAKSTVEHEVEQAIIEIEEPESGNEPEKQTIISHLQKAAETLQAAGATAVQAAAFGKLVGQAATWLGPHVDGLLKLIGL